MLASCVTAAERVENLDEPGRAAAVQRYQQAALELVQTGLQAGAAGWERALFVGWVPVKTLSRRR